MASRDRYYYGFLWCRIISRILSSPSTLGINTIRSFMSPLCCVGPASKICSLTDKEIIRKQAMSLYRIHFEVLLFDISKGRIMLLFWIETCSSIENMIYLHAHMVTYIIKDTHNSAGRLQQNVVQWTSGHNISVLQMIQSSYLMTVV